MTLAVRFRALAVVSCVVFGTVAAGAQERRHETRRVRLPAPTRVTTEPTIRAAPPADPRAERDRREAALRDHHLPGPPLGAAPTAAARATPANLPETDVTATTVALVTNRALTDAETNDVTSQVDEPSLAVRGDEILYTGNWYAAFSKDGGASFAYVNPATTFPAIPGQPFCCDQVALYDAEHDLMVWYLQYVEDGSGNTGRLAVAQGDDIRNEDWRIYDLTPQGLGGWTTEWLDFPDLAVSDNFLYLTTNVFTTPPYRFTRALVVRMPLDELAAYEALDLDVLASTEDFSFRPTQGATDAMFFASHVSLSSLRVFTWPESTTTATSTVVPVQAWSNDTRVAPGPDGRDWLGRVDARMTAAWRSGSTIGFAWTAAQDGDFPFPHVRVVLLDAQTKTVTGEPHLWSSSFAFAYPAAAPRRDGTVGLSVHFGGGPHAPSHAVGFYDAASSSWRLATTASGTHGPSSPSRWGDYLTVRPHGADPDGWVATGFVLRGGPSAADVEPRYVHFRTGPAPPVEIELVNLEPDRRIGNGETLEVRATVRRNGAPAPGETVVFRTDDEDRAIVVADATATDQDGVIEATVTSKTRRRGTVLVTAEVDGVRAQAPVLVPDVPGRAFAIGLFALALVLALGRGRRRRAAP